MASNATVPAISVEEQPHLHTAVIRASCPPDKLSETIGTVYGELWPYLQAAGAQITMPPFARYFTMDEQSVDFEGGMVLDQPIPASGRVQASELPSGSAAVTTHTGPYDRLSDTYDVIRAWLAGSDYEQSGPNWEVYVTDPGEEPNPTKWQTRIFMPVRRKGSA